MQRVWAADRIGGLGGQNRRTRRTESADSAVSADCIGGLYRRNRRNVSAESAECVGGIGGMCRRTRRNVSADSADGDGGIDEKNRKEKIVSLAEKRYVQKMVMVKREGLITLMEGKVGGDIHRVDQCGEHIQASPRLVKREPSKKQKKRRISFQQCLNRYLHILTPQQRQSWWIYSYRHPKKGKKGNVYVLPPALMYISYNINRVNAGLPFIDDAPL